MQEREQLDAARRCHLVVIDRDIRISADGLGERGMQCRDGVGAADQAHPGRAGRPGLAGDGIRDILLGTSDAVEPLVLGLDEDIHVLVAERSTHRRGQADRSTDGGRRPGADAGKDDAQQRLPRRIPRRPDRDLDGPVAEEVALHAQPRDIRHPPELLVPGDRVRERGAAKPLERGVIE